MKNKKTILDIYKTVNDSIELAFYSDKYELNFFEYLSLENYKKSDILEFISSCSYFSIQDQIMELNCYINENNFSQIYGELGKVKAQKIKDHLSAIIEDAKKYEQSKKQRRTRKPQSVATK